MVKSDSYVRCADESPPEGVLVMTKIDDEEGLRNQQPLIRRRNLFFVPDGKTYVYYTPTHWMPLPDAPEVKD